MSPLKVTGAPDPSSTLQSAPPPAVQEMALKSVSEVIVAEHDCALSLNGRKTSDKIKKYA